MIQILAVVIVLFLATLIHLLINTFRYWGSGDGANTTRILMIISFTCLVIHYIRLVFGHVLVGYFSIIAGLCWLLIFLRPDLLDLWDWLKNKK